MSTSTASSARCSLLLVLAVGCTNATETAPTSRTATWSGQLGGSGFQNPTSLAAVGDQTVLGGIFAESFAISGTEVPARANLDGLVAALDDSGQLRWPGPSRATVMTP